jgi:hypothetical protein
MLSVRGGSGLGDALYIQAIARYLMAQRHSVEVCSDWPDVFRPLAGKVKVSPFRRTAIDRLAHYSGRRGISGTTQFDDCCIQAGVPQGIEFILDWKLQDQGLVEGLKSDGRPIIVVQMPRAPFGRSDGYGLDLLPDCRRIQDAIDLIGERAIKVQVGAGDALYRFGGIDVDLTNRTSVAGLIDVASVADGFLGYCSFIVPLAECFDKPALLVWSRRGMRSRELIVRQITPTKILHKRSSRVVIDDCGAGEMAGAVNALCKQVRNPVAV